MSFDLGPEPFDPTCQSRLSSDDWLDDIQQGLVPGGSEPRTMDYNAKCLAMHMRPSLLDIMRKDSKDTDEKWEPPPASPEHASTPTMGFSYDYATDEPPDIQRMEETPMHSSPYPEPPKLHVRPGPVLLPPRPRSTSVPPIPTTVQKMAKRYMPITENVTPPISPACASAMDPETPTQRPGRSRGHGKWRAPPSATVGTRSQTRQAEFDAAEAKQAQASRAVWPEKHDHSLQIQRMTRDLHLRDTQEDSFREIQRTLPMYKIDENQNEVRPPAAGIHSHQQDVFFIPPPRAGGGAVGASTPVSTATLGLIHRVDPSLAVQLCEDPASLVVRTTRLRVYSTMRLIRTGMLGQLASLQQWEETMHAQDGQ